jgi:hypothetical protein
MWLHADSCDALTIDGDDRHHTACGLRWRVTAVTPPRATGTRTHTRTHTHTHTPCILLHPPLPLCAPVPWSQMTRPLIHAHSLGSRGFLASDFACRWASLLKRVGSFIRYSCASSASGVRPVTWSAQGGSVGTWGGSLPLAARRPRARGRHLPDRSVGLASTRVSGWLPICLSTIEVGWYLSNLPELVEVLHDLCVCVAGEGGGGG